MKTYKAKKSKRYIIRLEGTFGKGNGKILSSFDDEGYARDYAFKYNGSNAPEFQDAIMIDTKPERK